MTARYYLAITAIHSSEHNVDTLTTYLRFAIEECKILKANIQNDPAVSLLVSQLAFVTNTEDTPLNLRHKSLLDLCYRETANDAAFVQSPTNIN